MKKIIIAICVEDDAFANAPRTELSRILNGILQDIKSRTFNFRVGSYIPLMDINGNKVGEFNVVEDNESRMFSKENSLWRMLHRAIKTTGNYDDALGYIEEDLTHDEYTEFKNFLQWCTDNDRDFGSGNYYDVYLDFKYSIGRTK